MEHKIDGKALAEQSKQKLIERLSELVIKGKRKPGIVSFCNTEDSPSVKYTQMKQAKAEEVGIRFLVERYDTQTLEQDLRTKIRGYNLDQTIDGIMVQLPVPLELVVFKEDLLNLIDPQKDVDGLTVAGRKIYLPATVKSVISILESTTPGWEDWLVGVVGSEGEIGAPLVEIIREMGVEVVKIDRIKGDINTDLKDCKVVVSCVGRESLIKASMIKPGSVLIDVGLGDFDPECFAKAGKYTAKFGGVGPMTVISLMENVVEAYSKRSISSL